MGAPIQLMDMETAKARPNQAGSVERWRKVAGEPLWNEWVKKMEGKGHKEARDVLNTAVELLKN